ncbi:MAG: hypothetical protein N838_24585 [Thiohalocapsa sp. PB-PSB1]|jgi:quercetin dioxygenase-like cupin family protein|nr:MAG: hypothetical protein N838_24585 [Thiohalocapsa sp. PB-PSB1]
MARYAAQADQLVAGRKSMGGCILSPLAGEAGIGALVYPDFPFHTYSISNATWYQFMQIEHWHSERDGLLCEAAMRRKLEHRGYAVSRYDYAPGTFFPEHDHAVDKIDGLLSGRLRITMSGQEAVLEPGDMILVPKHVTHTTEVVGEETAVSLDAVRIR